MQLPRIGSAQALGKQWAKGQQILDLNTSSAPALAVFKHKLYCIYRNSEDDRVRETVYDGRQ
jgi:hypothetical protein